MAVRADTPLSFIFPLLGVELYGFEPSSDQQIALHSLTISLALLLQHSPTQPLHWFKDSPRKGRGEIEAKD